MNHDDTHPYALPSAAARHRMLAELDPYARVDDHITEPTAVVPAGTYGARPEKVGLALARIIDLVEAHADAGELDDLDKYLFGFTPGPAPVVEWAGNHGRLADWATGGVPDGYEPGHNRYANYPLANLGMHAEQDKEIRKAAGTLVRGGAS